MTKRVRGWHTPPKYVEPTTEGRCKICHKFVKSLEAHNNAKHKEKIT